MRAKHEQPAFILAIRKCALVVVFATFLLPAMPAEAGDPTVPFEPPEIAGVVLDEALSEISGLAVSRRHAGVLWAVNDSGNPAEVIAMSESGHKRATFSIAGARNVDWEDLAGFSRGHRHYLLIADTGDNGGVRTTLDLLLVEEPSEIRDAILPLARKLEFRWPDGARDCEAIAIDEARGEILLLSKRRVPAQLFRLPLAALFAAPANAALVAEEIAQVRELPQPTALELAREPSLGRFRAQVTGMAFRPDGVLAVQTYRDTYLYQRGPDEEWRQALRKPPGALQLSYLPQAESLAFDSRSGDLFVASERVPSPLIRLRALRAADPRAEPPAPVAQ